MDGLTNCLTHIVLGDASACVAGRAEVVQAHLKGSPVGSRRLEIGM